MYGTLPSDDQTEIMVEQKLVIMRFKLKISATLNTTLDTKP